MKHSTIRLSTANKAAAIFMRPTADGPARWLRALLLIFVLGVATALASLGADVSSSNLLSIAELQSATSKNGRAIRSFRVEGVVCAVVSERNMIVLQDDSAAALLEVPFLPGGVRAGEVVAVEGENCALTRNRWRLQLGGAPVVDNDGDHPALLKSGQVYLRPGVHPIRLMWFNSREASALNLEYEGPGVARQRIPDTVLWQKATEAGSAAQRGVLFAAYEGEGWFALPDFEKLKPVAQGVADNFDLAHRTRDAGVALSFSGNIEIATAGVYTFHLESDDGSRLYVGDPAAACKVLPLGRSTIPGVKDIEEVLAEAAGSQWARLEGRVVFAGQSEQGLDLELITGGDLVPMTVVNGAALLTGKLLQQQVRITGICEASSDPERRTRVRVIVPGADQVAILHPADDTEIGGVSPNALLTAARQVQRLTPERARENVHVKIKGVVTQASPRTLVLQDPTGGVFVHYSAADWTDQPRVGESWEIEGTTDPGDFSPVIRATTGSFLGNGTLPHPVRPSWDQLMNGSLDAQYVELEGVITDVSDTGLMLLTQDGKIRVAVDELRWSYVDGRELFVMHHDSVALEQMRQAYLGSVVRIRGCLVAVWNLDTRQVKAGEIRMVAAVVAVEEPRPADPFSLTTRSVVDLLRFDPRASALLRTKLAGQIIHAHPPEYYLMDGRTGCRVLAREPLPFAVGDLVEAVGFPRLNGSLPSLLEAEVRKTGGASLPEPVQIATQDLLNHEHDGILERVEAVLVNDSAQQDERVLELQAGPYYFVARLKIGRKTWKPLTPGSRLQLTGVQTGVTENRGGASVVPFELLLNNPGAIVVLQQGPWWTVRHTITVVGLLVAGLGIALIWIKLLRRKVEERTAQLAAEIEERQRVEQHRAMEQERTRVAQDLHDELGAGLTEMGILGSLAKNPGVPPEEKERYLDQLNESARSLVTGLDEIVWAINPQYDSVGSLATYYSFFAERFLNLAGIACRLQVAEFSPDYHLDAKVRHSVFLAFKEALNNIVRHSGATEVELKIEVTGKQLTISIRDNGRGFASGTGIPGSDGLAGMRERLRQLGGVSEIRSQPGQGTTVEFRLGLEETSHDQSRHR